jgi:UDP-N-acetyl-D-galactosamine dehydrogenase
VAEAAKVIENTQRDLNIALMNELSLIFHRIGIDTLEVLEGRRHQVELPALPPRPGGRALHRRRSVLPDHKAEKLGYHPQVILAGRRINDGMGKFVAEQTVKELIAADLPVKGADVIVLGMTFKENCPDLRNSKVIDSARRSRAEHEYGIKLTPWEQLPRASAIVAAVAHKQYAEMGLKQIAAKAVDKAVFTDVKAAYDPAEIAAQGLNGWRL